MIPKPPESVATLRDADHLAAFVARMRAGAWVAVDTEFLRERTYYPKLCLVQIANAEEVGLIDVLAIEDLEPLTALLGDPALLKVFHSAEQDLEVLDRTFGFLPAPLFDTQLAAPLAGFDDQMGYARLVKALLDIDLPKAHTRTDWSKRPLPDGALDYAADDVRYLAVAYARLGVLLDERGRADWLAPDFAQMVDAGRFEVETTRAWRRIKSWHRLYPDQQQALAELAAWREREAMAADRPRKWILADDALMGLARARPTDTAALDAIRALPPKTVARHGDRLLDCIATAAARPDRPLDVKPEPPTPAQRQAISTGMKALAERARTLDIPPESIASRKEIAAMVDGARDLRLLTGWREEAAGRAVLDAITNPPDEH